MDDTSSYDGKRKWFLWGTVLTWVLSIPFVFAMFNAFRGISGQKATGLGAVAGGLGEGYFMFGVVLAFVLPVVAIFLLVRSFAGATRKRNVFSVLYICFDALMITLAGLFLWGFIQLRHM